jgi:hypothetical protein
LSQASIKSSQGTYNANNTINLDDDEYDDDDDAVDGDDDNHDGDDMIVIL